MTLEYEVISSKLETDNVGWAFLGPKVTLKQNKKNPYPNILAYISHKTVLGLWYSFPCFGDIFNFILPDRLLGKQPSFNTLFLIFPLLQPLLWIFWQLQVYTIYIIFNRFWSPAPRFFHSPVLSNNFDSNKIKCAFSSG